MVGQVSQPAAYTRNPVCAQFRCVNPIFPGLMLHGQNMLSLQENKSWSCVGDANLIEEAGICGQVVAGYQFSLPTGEDGTSNQKDIAAGQAQLALTAYVAHLSAIGYDFWDYRAPWHHDECIQSVWKMACYSYFPKCSKFDNQYLRPCAGTCESYIRACQVECCDEGVRCSFVHDSELADGTLLREHGYVDHPGPAPFCTGAASTVSHLNAFFLVKVVAMIGCLYP